jgi:hypothetical protein
MPFSAGLGGGVAGWPGGAKRSRRADRSSSCGVISCRLLVVSLKWQ